MSETEVVHTLSELSAKELRGMGFHVHDSAPREVNSGPMWPMARGRTSRRRASRNAAKASASSDGNGDPPHHQSPLIALILEALRNPQVQREIEAIALAATDAERAEAEADYLMTVPEAAERLGMSVGAIRQRIARGSIPVKRIGRTVRLSSNQLKGVCK